MPGKFDLKRAKNGQYYFNLKAGNGEIILTSEMYKQKASCENGIASVQKNAAEAGRFDRRESKTGKPYFVLKAGNHEVIGNSEMYESASSMENGIKSVMKNAPEATINDISDA